MAVVARASLRKRICGSDTVDGLLSMLRLYSLPDKTGFSAPEIAQAALSEKKRKGGSIDLVVPVSIGRCEIRSFPVGELKAFIASGLE
jgi:3-dehydroquinate synthase